MIVCEVNLEGETESAVERICNVSCSLNDFNTGHLIVSRQNVDGE